MRRLALCAALAFATTAGAAPVYVAIPLGSIGHFGGFAAGMNDLGHVVGYYYDAGGTEHAFVHDGAFRSLGLPEDVRSYAIAINANGTIIGNRIVDGARLGFAWRAGKFTDLGATANCRRDVRDINASGWITGAAVYPNGIPYAYVDDGTLFDLGVDRDAGSEGNAINDAGMVTGGMTFASYTNQPPRPRAFLSSGLRAKELGTLGGNFSAGLGLDAGGDVVGWSSTGADELPHAFLYDGMTMMPIGPPAYISLARSINDRREAIGSYSSTETDVVWRSFYHDAAEGVSHDLDGLLRPPMPGSQMHSVNTINQRGQISGTACSVAPSCFPVRLDPVAIPAESPSAVRVTAIEYYHAGFDHYFLSIDPAEIAALDRGAFSGWVRTGESFELYREPVVGAAPMCRFFSASFAPKSSHFFTAALAECLDVLANPNWEFEGVRMFALAPDASGVCPTGTSPVYRLYNDGQGGAPAHRFTTRRSIQSELVARGWIREGVGADGVGYCTATAAS